jgi:hypothetical protein
LSGFCEWEFRGSVSEKHAVAHCDFMELAMLGSGFRDPEIGSGTTVPVGESRSLTKHRNDLLYHSIKTLSH